MPASMAPAATIAAAIPAGASAERNARGDGVLDLLAADREVIAGRGPRRGRDPSDIANHTEVVLSGTTVHHRQGTYG